MTIAPEEVVDQRVPTPGFASDPAWSPLLTAT